MCCGEVKIKPTMMLLTGIFVHSFIHVANQQMGFPDSSVVKNPPVKQETWIQSLGWEDPLEKEMATHTSILAWEKKSHGQRSLAGYSPWGCKESDTTEQLNNKQQSAETEASLSWALDQVWEMRKWIKPGLCPVY